MKLIHYKMKKIILLSTLYLILSTALVQAAGLVPCGDSGEPDCNWCFLMQMVKNVIDFLVYIAIPLAVLMIIVGGIMIMTAAGSTSRVAKGREILTAAIVGLIIALLSWLIIDTILKMLVGAPEGGSAAIIKGLGPWNQIQCP
jgi:hypothetical protein